MVPDQLLTVNNLSLSRYGGKTPTHLVHEVNFSIDRQEIVGLMGESGSGKSLTCLSLIGLLPRTIRFNSGEICFKGTHLTGMKQSLLRSIRGKDMAMILQNPMSCFDSVFTIGSHFRETLQSHGLSWTKNSRSNIYDSLSEVGFEKPAEILDLYPFQMSGGMLQRVMIALALMMKVSLLIADEPTTDLDLVSQSRVLSLLAKMRDQHGMSILLVTHDLSVIAHLADRAIIMQQGKIVDGGPVKTIFAQGQHHQYTKALLDAHFDLYEPHSEWLER